MIRVEVPAVRHQLLRIRTVRLSTRLSTAFEQITPSDPARGSSRDRVEVQQFAISCV